MSPMIMCHIIISYKETDFFLSFRSHDTPGSAYALPALIAEEKYILLYMPNIVKGSTYSAGPVGHVMSEVWLGMFVFLPDLRFRSNA